MADATRQANRWHRSVEVLEVAREWCDRCLQGNGSMLTASRLWTTPNLSALTREYHENFSAGRNQKFLPRLKLQLANAPPAVQRLAAEVLWILYLSVSSRALKGATKRRHIAEIWSLSGVPVPWDAPALGTVLDEGVANPNPGFSIHGWRDFVFCIELVSSWKRLPARKRAHLIADSWRFAGWLDELPGAEQRQFRHILLYLLFPETFERIVALGPKREVVRTFLPRFGLDPRPALRGRVIELDRALARIRPLLEDRYGGPVVDYYMPPVNNDWDGGNESSRRRAADDSRPRRTEIATAAYRLWEVLAGLAEDGSRAAIRQLAARVGARPQLVTAALQDIAGYCLSRSLPPLVIIVSTPEPLLPELAALTAEERAIALAEVGAYPWDAYGNPYRFAARGAGYEELLSRLVLDPDSAADVFALVRHRGRAQQVFRDALIRVYGGRCAVTGLTIRAGLEAAHLVPWSYASCAQRVDVRNGILLASWHHRLFDAGILTLDEELRIQIDADALAGASPIDRAALKELKGKPLHLPSDPVHHPDVALVRLRKELARTRAHGSAYASSRFDPSVYRPFLPTGARPAGSPRRGSQ